MNKPNSKILYIKTDHDNFQFKHGKHFGEIIPKKGIQGLTVEIIVDNN